MSCVFLAYKRSHIRFVPVVGKDCLVVNKSIVSRVLGFLRGLDFLCGTVFFRLDDGNFYIVWIFVMIAFYHHDLLALCILLVDDEHSRIEDQ